MTKPSRPTDLDGLWTFGGQTEPELDRQQAKKAGHHGLHGTFTKTRLYRIRTEKEGGKDYARLIVFDENANVGVFLWNDDDGWATPDEPPELTFSVSADNKLAPSGKTLSLSPRLALKEYDEQNPKGSNTGECFPFPIEGSLPKQKIVYDAIEETFTWSQDSLTLQFVKAVQQKRADAPKDSPDASFGNIFRTVHETQITLPFTGFHCKALATQKLGGLVQVINPGTSPSTPASNPRQKFIGTLLFSYPTDASMDYVRAQDIDDMPFLPLGLSQIELDDSLEKKHTTIASSMADHIRGWSASLGLSGGLTGVFSAGLNAKHKEKSEEETKRECRQVISEEVERTWIAHPDFKTMQLHPDYVAAIKSRLIALLSNKPVDWPSFASRFGTHYAHAITYGNMMHSETSLSMQDETVALSGETSIDFKAGLEVGGIKAKVSGGYSNEFADKHGMTLSNENVKIAKIGFPHPVAIFFDLRPASELMNPIFLEYAQLDDWKSLAPFVWCDLRNSFDAYLASPSLGVGENIPSVFFESYTPRTVKISVPKLTILGPGSAHYKYTWRGTISMEPIGDAVEYGQERKTLEFKDPQKFDDNGTYQPDVFCNLAARENQRSSAGFRVSCDLVIHKEGGSISVDHPVKLQCQMNLSDLHGKVIRQEPFFRGSTNELMIEVNVEEKAAQS